MATKAELHRLVDELPESETQAARRCLQYLRDCKDPVLAALENAPEDDEDDEDESPDEKSAADKARQDLKDGKIVSSDKLRDNLGL